MEPLKNKCETIIGVYVNPLEDIALGDLKHSGQIANRAYIISFLSRSVSKFKNVDILIAPQRLKNDVLFNLKNIDAIFEIGYEAAIEALLKLKLTFFSYTFYRK